MDLMSAHVQVYATQAGSADPLMGGNLSVEGMVLLDRLKLLRDCPPENFTPVESKAMFEKELRGHLISVRRILLRLDQLKSGKTTSRDIF